VDIVITTYQTLVSEWKKPNRNSKGLGTDSQLRITPYTVFWRRIVLEEGKANILCKHDYTLLIGRFIAHVIRNGATLIARAMCNLQGDRRWVVTGTPVQNSLEDLAPLFEFLKAYPFDSRKTFLSEIAKGSGTDQFKGLKALMGAVTLRRTSQVLIYPESQSIIRMVRFTPAERRAYDEAKKGIDAAVTNQATSPVLQTLLEIRRMCNHGLLQTGMKVDPSQVSTKSWNPGTAQEAFLAMLDNDAAECSVCGRNLALLTAEDTRSIYHELFKCLHLRCDQCLAGGGKEANGCQHEPKCPSHHVRHLRSEAPTLLLNRLELDQIPSKVMALIDDIRHSVPGEKR
jgi:SWI/SNF-related matrix-associated actin-dependent regulator of chromatin subfamily A3